MHVGMETLMGVDQFIVLHFTCNQNADYHTLGIELEKNLK